MSSIFDLNLLNSYYQIFNNINEEHGYNVITHANDIKSPELKEYKKNIFIINLTYNLIDKLNNKKQINESDVIIIPNSGDRNCFYKCISKFNHNKEEYHIYYRKLICEYINSKKVHEMNQHPYLPDIYNNKTLL